MEQEGAMPQQATQENEYVPPYSVQLKCVGLQTAASRNWVCHCQVQLDSGR